MTVTKLVEVTVAMSESVHEEDAASVATLPKSAGTELPVGAKTPLVSLPAGKTWPVPVGRKPLRV